MQAGRLSMRAICFNPCFNGFMDKDRSSFFQRALLYPGFNPCFNGFMDKDKLAIACLVTFTFCFNPCFNGFMDKDQNPLNECQWHYCVSTLVLMDSWIKTPKTIENPLDALCFNPCFNGFMDKDQKSDKKQA